MRSDLQHQLGNKIVVRYVPRRGHAWTEEDLQVARDRSLTVKEAARRLGRTYYAITRVRYPRG